MYTLGDMHHDIDIMHKVQRHDIEALMSSDCLEKLQKVRRTYQKGICTYDEMIQMGLDVLLSASLATKKVYRVAGYKCGVSEYDDCCGGLKFDSRTEAVEYMRELRLANMLDVEMGMPKITYTIIEEEE